MHCLIEENSLFMTAVRFNVHATNPRHRLPAASQIIPRLLLQDRRSYGYYIYTRKAEVAYTYLCLAFWIP